ncbi:YerC/YecD family TrpR-related protein [Boudabousia marimammalium]|uniref:DNA-binding transcriptional regulator n=1 Tax=Boudabousia marimammalium TaxID=156892 RepID=A0A1Q5PRS8_9ACTO|nr:YerC/YecD family TrpR-related protein [Boudabousia marimammalium]OKL50287.1 DNA-binding transcriptional regulator [Boudabousia marimammalium]
MKRRGEAVSQPVEDLATILAQLNDPGEVADFLHDLCTPSELEAMADRWSVVPLLAAGASYRKVHELTGVSVTTIGRVARYYASGAGGYERALELLSDRQTEN